MVIKIRTAKQARRAAREEARVNTANWNEYYGNRARARRATGQPIHQAELARRQEERRRAAEAAERTRRRALAEAAARRAREVILPKRKFKKIRPYNKYTMKY
ncbi:MAG: hypothetical protein [Circoviridae sp.]|nr:MAG: hypothetical protein [Circoviridae sp.]